MGRKTKYTRESLIESLKQYPIGCGVSHIYRQLYLACRRYGYDDILEPYKHVVTDKYTKDEIRAKLARYNPAEGLSNIPSTLKNYIYMHDWHELLDPYRVRHSHRKKKYVSKEEVRRIEKIERLIRWRKDFVAKNKNNIS